MEIIWEKASNDNLPDECRPVLIKYSNDGELFGIATIIDGEWVTDASESDLYNATAHEPIGEKISLLEWAYID